MIASRGARDMGVQSTGRGLKPGKDPGRGASAPCHTRSVAEPVPALLFDLDGTLVDSVYQHVLAWHEVLGQAGRELSLCRIHRRTGIRGGRVVNPRPRVTGP